MNILRICKVLVCIPLALFALLTGIDNLIDYGSNYSFVRHVLSMDTVFSNNTLKWRAIDQPIIWHFAYAMIISGEILTGVLLSIGAIGLARRIHSRDQFIRAKNWVYLGCTAGFLVWFFGFLVIGGEWFSMWQSDKWNGAQAAFRFVVVIMLVMIFIAMPEEE